MRKDIDCILCGSCVADILCRPVRLDVPIGAGRLLSTEPLQVATGGLVSNAGVAMARLGMKSAAFTYVGRDEWARLIRGRLEAEGLDCTGLLEHPTASTSTTVVLIDPSGERSFAHCVGAPKLMDRRLYFDHLHLFARSRMTLIGYYSLMPNLEGDLAEVLAAIRETGCRTALDCAGSGGSMQPLDRLLPHLDVYVPSLNEAVHQTALDDPRAVLGQYRACGAAGLVGVKLGARGVLLSPAGGEYIEIPALGPPGPIVDTTGAGDCFYAGLLTGLLRGLDVRSSGLLGAAAGACCITALGATAGIRDFAATAELAGITAWGQSKVSRKVRQAFQPDSAGQSQAGKADVQQF
jgi:sugar/nucleoside kinase (ribokinase family)